MASWMSQCCPGDPFDLANAAYPQRVTVTVDLVAPSAGTEVGLATTLDLVAEGVPALKVTEAVPVIGRNGTFFGAVSIAAPDVRAGKARLRRFLPALKSAATRLAEALSQQPTRSLPRARARAR